MSSVIFFFHYIFSGYCVFLFTFFWCVIFFPVPFFFFPVSFYCLPVQFPLIFLVCLCFFSCIKVNVVFYVLGKMGNGYPPTSGWHPVTACFRVCTLKMRDFRRWLKSKNAAINAGGQTGCTSA